MTQPSDSFEGPLGALVPLEALPGPLQRAVEDTADVFRLPRGWFNAGPRSLMDLGLPEGVLNRAHRRDWGGLICKSLIAATRSSSSCTPRSIRVRAASTSRTSAG